MDKSNIPFNAERIVAILSKAFPAYEVTWTPSSWITNIREVNSITVSSCNPGINIVTVKVPLVEIDCNQENTVTVHRQLGCSDSEFQSILGILSAI